MHFCWTHVPKVISVVWHCPLTSAVHVDEAAAVELYEPFGQTQLK
jgi:hypothetical protein